MIEKPVIFMFSGLGSQYYNMGRELFEHNKIFHNYMSELDSIIYEVTGKSVIEYIYSNKKRLDDLTLSQLAIFLVEYSLYKYLIDFGLKPDYLLGSSLGEFISLTIAGIFSIEDQIKSIVRQSKAVIENCEKAMMISIFNDFSDYCKDSFLLEKTELAMKNYESHFVVSIKNEYWKSVMKYLKDRNILFYVLPISYGFHSSLIDSAKTAYTQTISGKLHIDPQIPVISCLYKKQLKEINRTYFWDVARQTIDFQQTIKKLEEKRNNIYIDLGPSGTLSNFVKYNLNKNADSEVYTILNPFHKDLKHFNRITNSLKHLRLSYEQK